jgi:hypothetical protein
MWKNEKNRQQVEAILANGDIDLFGMTIASTPDEVTWVVACTCTPSMGFLSALRAAWYHLEASRAVTPLPIMAPSEPMPKLRRKPRLVNWMDFSPIKKRSFRL